MGEKQIFKTPEETRGNNRAKRERKKDNKPGQAAYGLLHETTGKSNRRAQSPTTRRREGKKYNEAIMEENKTPAKRGKKGVQVQRQKGIKELEKKTREYEGKLCHRKEQKGKGDSEEREPERQKQQRI
jgi:hypothetical protein